MGGCARNSTDKGRLFVGLLRRVLLEKVSAHEVIAGLAFIFVIAAVRGNSCTLGYFPGAVVTPELLEAWSSIGVV